MKEKQDVKRKDVARMVHEFLRDELKEPDEIDSSPAYRLQDLFDCRVCAGHVIQVYVKGIMDGYKNADGRLVFGMNDFVSREEAEEIRKRVFEKECRQPKKSGGISVKVERIVLDEVIRLCREDATALVVDVRTQKEYEECHFKNAVNLPLMSIFKNPYGVSERRDLKILLYCAEGYQSEAAARCLLEAGYEKVSCFAWKPE